MNNHEYLYAVNVFDEKYKLVYDKLKSIAVEKSFKKNQHIFMVRDVVEYIYIVKKGIVTLYGIDKNYNEKIYFLLKTGDFVNDDIVINNEGSTSAYAFSDCELLCIKKSEIFELMHRNIDVMEFMFRSNINKLTRTYRQLKNSSTTISIDKRLGSKLWKLAKDFGENNENGIAINVNVNTIFLAKMLGTTRETVSRSMKKLCDKGIIVPNHTRIIIKDLDKLMKYIKSEK